MNRKKKVKKASATYRTCRSHSAVSFDLCVRREGLEPILGAAYLMTDRAFAHLEGDRTDSIQVTLRSKKPASGPELKSLAKTFLLELETQKVRWAIAKNNLPIREYIAEQAVLLANGNLPPPPAPPAPAGEELTVEQRQEIEKLIAEVEQEIKALNDKKTVSDPKNLKASWEEKQESRLREAKS